MTKEEFSLLVKGMKAIYTFDNFLADDYSKEMWYALLKDLPYQAAGAALKAHMQTSPKVPTPADIRSGVFSLTQKERLSDGEAWGMVSKAISRSGYHSHDEYAKLPPEIQKAIGTERQLYTWSQTDTDSVETVIQSQFLRSYRTECQRAEQRQKMSPDLIRLTEELTMRLEGKIEAEDQIPERY